MDKRALRRECFSRVREIPGGEKAAASAAIARHLESMEVFREAGTVFAYLALASEPDLGPLWEAHPEKRWGFSRVEGDGARLAFHEVGSRDQLVEGNFGFLEPDPERCGSLAVADLVLVPGVGFDPANGARLGRGKGHYDRFLAPLVSSPDAPLVVGTCFATQLVELEPEPHDVPMDRIVCEDGFLRR